MPRSVMAEIVGLGEEAPSQRTFRRRRRGVRRRPVPIAARTRAMKRRVSGAFRGLEARLMPRLTGSGLLERAYDDAFRRLTAREKAGSLDFETCRAAWQQQKDGIGRGGQPLSTELEEALSRIFGLDAVEALAGLTEAEIADWIVNLESILAEEFVAAYNVGGTAARRFLGVRPSFDLRNPGILQALEDRANLLSGGIGDDIFERMKTVIARDFYFEGMGPKEVARSLRSEFDWLSRARSELIAHQETLSVTEEAEHDLYVASGVRAKRWLTTLDGRERPSHFAAHGQIRAIDEPFELEDPDTGEKAELMHPGDDSRGAPPEFIMRCRCAMIPIVHESQLMSDADVWAGDVDPDEFSKERIAERRGMAGDFFEETKAVKHRFNRETGHWEPTPGEREPERKPRRTGVREEVIAKTREEWIKEGNLGLPDDPAAWTIEDYDKERARKQEWEAEVLKAVSLGTMAPADARAKGSIWIDAKDWKPLPETLFHVTTAKDAVLEEGLRTRAELGQRAGAGLGGGPENTISFTADEKIAEGIKAGLLEMRDVAQGTFTIADMVEQARAGDRASRPWIDDLARHYGGGEAGLGAVDLLLRGRRTEGGPINPKPLADVPAGWTPQGDGVVGRDGVRRFFYWERPATVEERQDDAVQFYKVFAGLRESAGGPLDPLFFASDATGLAHLDPAQIAVLEFEPVPGAMGTQASGLGEWRTGTGEAVRLRRAKGVCRLCGLSHRDRKGGCPCPEPPGRTGPCACEGGGEGGSAAPPQGGAREAWRPPRMETVELERRATRWKEAEAAYEGVRTGIQERIRATLAAREEATARVNAAADALKAAGTQEESAAAKEVYDKAERDLEIAYKTYQDAANPRHPELAAAREKYDRVAVALGADFFYEVARGDPGFMRDEVKDIGDFWKHTGGPRQSQVRFAVNAAFGLDAPVWDDDAKQFVTLETKSTADLAQIARFAGAMRAEWEDSQQELANESFEYELIGDDDAYKQAEEEQYDAWRESPAWETFRDEQAAIEYKGIEFEHLKLRDAVEQHAGGRDALIAWGEANIDNLAASVAANDRPPSDAAGRRAWIADRAVRPYNVAHRDEILAQFTASYEPPESRAFEIFKLDVFNRSDVLENFAVEPRDWPITLYRGWDPDKPDRPYVASTVDSWTISPGVAKEFGKTVMQAEFPRERVLVFHGSKNWMATGGGYNEGEFMILADLPSWMREPRTRGAEQLALPLKRTGSAAGAILTVEEANEARDGENHPGWEGEHNRPTHPGDARGLPGDRGGRAGWAHQPTAAVRAPAAAGLVPGSSKAVDGPSGDALEAAWPDLLPWMDEAATKAFERAVGLISTEPGQPRYAKGLRYHDGRWYPACRLCGLTHRAKGGCPCPEAPGRSGPCACEGGAVGTATEVPARYEGWSPRWVEAQPERFIELRNRSTRTGYLSPLEPTDIRDHKVIVSNDGKVGAAVSPEGDIQNVFNNGGPKGAATEALLESIHRGGRTLDCFDGYLPSLYTQFGFRETGRMKFNREFAPAGWNYERDDEPDVVFMARIEEEDDDAIRDRALGRKADWLVGTTSSVYYTDFDEAKSESRRAGDRRRGRPGEGKGVGGFPRRPDSVAGAGDRRPVAKHYGPGPHPGTGTPQTVHGFAARAESIGLDPKVATEVRQSYVFEGGKVKTGPDGKPVLTPAGEARVARVRQFIETELAKRGESEYDSQRRFGKDDEDGLATDPERRKLQLKVIDDYLKSQEELGAAPQENPVALITGGLGGAGKTRTLEMMGFEMGDDRLTGERTPKGYVVINPDILKGLIHANGGSIQVPGLTPGEASTFLHEEASAMAKYLSREATTRGYNVVWDYTMGSASSAVERIRELADRNGPVYTVDTMFVDIPPERSQRSAEQRWHGGNAGALNNLLGFDDKWKSADYGDTFMGRYVPAGFIAAADGKNRQAFDTIVQNWLGAVGDYEKKIGRPVPELAPVRIRHWDRYENRWDENGKRYVVWAAGSRAGGPPGGIVDSRPGRGR